MSLPCCPDCGIQLIELPDFFGSPRLKHPDIECKRVLREERKHIFTSVSCVVCKEPFVVRAKGYRRITCSDKCLGELSKRNLKSAPRPNIKSKPDKWAERYRKFWQKKALEQDARLNRRVA